MPNYFLNDFAFAAEFIAGNQLSNLRLQFDIYHRQILHGDVLTALRAMFPIIGHVQIAAVRGGTSREEGNSRTRSSSPNSIGSATPVSSVAISTSR